MSTLTLTVQTSTTRTDVVRYSQTYGTDAVATEAGARRLLTGAAGADGYAHDQYIWAWAR